MNITNKIISLLACAFIMPISAAQAVTPLDKASFFVGIAIPDSTTQIEFNNNIGGVPVDFNKDLGLKTDNVIALVGVTWRPWDNHQFGFTYFGNSGSNTKSLSDPIEWNGVVYDGTVETSLDFETYDFSYIWWGLNKENYALGPSIRLSYITLDSKINLTIDADGDPVVGDAFKRSGNTDLPAPTIGVAWRWVPADQWRINMEAGYMQATIGDFDGSAVVASGGVAWFPWENWGFSLNAIYMDFDVNANSNANFIGKLKATQSNFNFGITYRF